MQFPDIAAEALEDGVKRLGLKGGGISAGFLADKEFSGAGVRRLLGEGTGARRAALHAPRRRHGAEAHLRRQRQPWQHGRQPARDDDLPVASDL